MMVKITDSLNQLRIDNFKMLIQNEYGDSVNSFAKKFELNVNQYYSILRGERLFGDKVARKIEKLAGLQKNSLDNSVLPEGKQLVPLLTEYSDFSREIIKPVNMFDLTWPTDFKINIENYQAPFVLEFSTHQNTRIPIYDLSKVLFEPENKFSGNGFYLLLIQNFVLFVELELTIAGIVSIDNDNKRTLLAEEMINEKMIAKMILWLSGSCIPI